MKYRYCLVGTGIGGGMLLRSLIDKGCKEPIAVVEAGGQKRKKEEQYESVGLPFRMITTSVQLGGTSNLWHGVLSYLDDIDFEKREWIPKSGWPITKTELMPYYQKAAAFWGVERVGYFEEQNLPKNLHVRLNDMGFNREYLENKLFQQPLQIKSLRSDVNELAAQYDNVHLFTQSAGLELILNESGTRYTACKIGKSDGTTDLIEADTFILCAGALETPRILLNSEGQTNPNIGHYLMDHPMGNLVQLEFKKPKYAPLYSDLRYGKGTKLKTGLIFKREIQEKYRLPNHNFYIRPSFVRGIDDMSEKIKLSLLTYKSGQISLRDVWKTITHLNVVKQILTYKYSLNVKYHYADLFFLTEQIPYYGSYVGLSDKKDQFGYPISKVDWQLSDYDKANMKQVFDLCLREFFKGEEVSFTHQAGDYFWENIFTSGAHHVGTARMATTADDGVVDADLKVFGFENLYLCDGSVFPTSGNVNIGLTISAFAMRLAQKLTSATR